VGHAEGVQVVHGLEDLEEDPATLVLSQTPLGLDVGAEVAAVQALHDQVHALGRLDRLVHTGDARVGELLHDLDFRVHALPVRGVLELGLVVGLDRDLRAGQSVPGSAHFAVGAHAHHLADHVHVHHRRAGRDDAAARPRGQQQELPQLEGVPLGAELVGHGGQADVDVVLAEGVQRGVASIHTGVVAQGRAVGQLEGGGGSGHGHLWVGPTVHRLAVHLVVVVVLLGLDGFAQLLRVAHDHGALEVVHLLLSLCAEDEVVHALIAVVV
jgi:hypothetical protein